PYSPTEPAGLDLADVRGQPLARRALEVAAAGGHDLLLLGPPGGGKTLLARRLPTLLPPLAFAEAVEVTTIHSVAGLVDPAIGVVASRPFRAPHHTVTAAGLVGGGDVPRPGELSLAHHGVLFLDELAEFRREALEALRGPLEDGVVTVARVRATARFPARPLLVAATNLCPCGLLGHPTRVCRCSEVARRVYLSRLSGPLLDRIDLHVRVPPVELSALVGGSPGEASAPVQTRVARARFRQEARRRAGEVSAPLNARLTPRELDRVAPLDPESRALLSAAAERLGLSARAFTKIRRVARTLADLGDRDEVTAAEVAEAIQGRVLDGGRA
ncbi:MAG: ATP-binding protein, partial [Deltaproteobacteria bacterium]|nr:ATP-binding protein [Deltaproteobacteria bacterium]